ncbi:MAG: response regulator transcription factor [Colwellia sp.]|nr:response regulator transcription factor [Colwellia sp.]
MITVLLVEDDLDLATTVVDYLELENMQCDHAANGIAGLQLIEQQKQYHPFDVIILDVNMPRMDGLTMCKQMREQGINTPVLMLTARDTLEDKLSGFDVGIDDYMVKPFEMLELVARLKVLSNRRTGQINKLILHGLEVDFSSKTALRNNLRLQFTPTGWKILEVLMRKSPEIVSKEQLKQAIWGDDFPQSNSLKVHLYNLRQQIDGPQFEAEIKLIHTISGQGFSFGLKNE